MTEKIRYDTNHIYYETYDHGIMTKRIVCPISFAETIVEAEAKSPFKALDMSDLFRTTSVAHFLNSIR